MTKDDQARKDIEELKKGIATLRDRMNNAEGDLEAIEDDHDKDMNFMAAELNHLTERVRALEKGKPTPEPEPEPEPGEPTETWSADKHEPVWGLDISSHQGADINFDQLYAEGYRFVFIKASQGTSYKNPYYDITMAAARAAQFIPGAYHFLEGRDPKQQVDNYLSAIRDPKGLMHAVDVESINSVPSPQKYHLWGFLRELAFRCGKDTTFWCYSGDWYFLASGFGNPQFKELEAEGIKVAVWSTPNEGYPGGSDLLYNLYGRLAKSNFDQGQGFGGKPTKILQVSDKVYTKAISPVDGNAFGGTLKELKTYPLGRTSPGEPTPPEPTQETGEEMYRAIRKYGDGMIGVPYGIWPGGLVPSGSPAHASNTPAPPLEWLKDEEIFCAGVGNILRRLFYHIFFQETIPYRPTLSPNTRELYDGGTWAWDEFFASAGEQRPFSLTQENGEPWPPLTVFGKRYGGTELGSQGHWSMQWFNGRLLQSFISRSDGWPGVNTSITLKDSHGDGYYDFVIPREAVWPPELIEYLEGQEKEGLLDATYWTTSENYMVGKFDIYREWTMGRASLLDV